ncbi:MAG: WG repeat-containing protein, partial [Bacteroidota bacterium]
MKAAIVIAIISLIINTCIVYAQQYDICDNGKYTYYTFDNEENKLPCIYDTAVAGNIMEVGMLGKDGKYALIDAKLQFISEWYEYIDFEVYDMTELFYPVRNEGKWNLLNEKGKPVLKEWVDSIQYRYWEMDNYIKVPVFLNGKINFVTRDGKILCKEWVDEFYDMESMIEENMAFIRIGGKWSMIGGKGKTIMPWVEMIDFNPDHPVWYMIEITTPVRIEGKWYLMLPMGNIIKSGYDDMVHDYTNFLVTTGDTLLYLDGEGNYGEGSASFEESFRFYNDLALVKKNGLWGFINREGKPVIDYQFELASQFGHTGCSKVRKNGKWGFILHDGTYLAEAIYEDAGDFSLGLANVKLNGLWGYLDTKGKTIIEHIYQEATAFSNEGALVKKEGKYGFIDMNGREIIPFIYDDATRFSQNLAAVKKDGKWGYIDEKGNTVIDFIFYRAGSFMESGIAIVKNDSYKEGIIDKEGKLIGNTWYDWIFNFYGG